MTQAPWSHLLRFSFVFLFMLTFAATAVARQRSWTVRVTAGEQGHRDAVVAWELPDDAKPEAAKGAAVTLTRLDGGGETPVAVQLGPWSLSGKPTACWMVRGVMKPGETRRYRLTLIDLAPKVTLSTPGVDMTDDGKSLRFSVADKPVVAYNHAVMLPPEGVEPVFARSGYLHPVFSPAGKLVTNDFPLQHKHHHGIWFPWTRTVFEGQRTDFWNSKKEEGRVEFVKFDGHGSGPVFGWFTSRHQHIALKAKGGPKPALDEIWHARVYPTTDYRLFDLTSVQTCASDSPLKLVTYRYGGLGFRGSAQWEGDDVQFLTSEGKTREDGHATTAKWCAVFGQVDGAFAGVAILCHPSNFRAPQPMRIHPKEPFFNYAPSQAGDFAIKPGKPYVSRYRFVVYDGEPDAAMLESLWSDYAAPPKVQAE